MKKFVKYILISIILVSFAFVAFKITSNYKIDMLNKNLNWNIKWKGESGGNSITFDNDGNMYIAFKDEVKVISQDGKSTRIFGDKELNISYIEYYKNRIYYASGTKVAYYDLEKKESKVLLNDLPNFGDYKESKILFKDNDMYISIGAATNSGVVGDDNAWAKDSGKCDITPNNLIVKGKNISENDGGAFIPYGNKNSKGQVIEGRYPGNASIIKVDPDTGKNKLYAWGIRNIEGWDVGSDNKIYGIIGGMEERGLRPVYGDKDYIYEIEEGIWYGWPDYSGGDSIDSPRFREEDGRRTLQILEEHPSINPPAPVYQHKDVSSIYYLCIDNEGKILNKDTFVFYDKKEHSIYKMEKGKVSIKLMDLTDNMKINDIEIYGENIYLLDGNGYVYEVMNKEDMQKANIPVPLIIVLCFVIFGLITVFITRNSKDKS